MGDESLILERMTPELVLAEMATIVSEYGDLLGGGGIELADIQSLVEDGYTLKGCFCIKTPPLQYGRF